MAAVNGATLARSFRVVVIAVAAACALALLGAVALLAAGLVIEGAVLFAVVAFSLRTFWRATLRKRQLARAGYFSGRRVGAHWVYEELHGDVIAGIELPLDYVGRGEYIVHIPGEHQWHAHMPEWARGRRDEIVERLGAVFKRSQMQFDADGASDG
ncbi:MAG TPA: hypothetical protein VFP37_01200 [Steroidobacteraceae bacterium]|nr:hypothetical protein [Steroidobacteraceae bacterium]